MELGYVTSQSIKVLVRPQLKLMLVRGILNGNACGRFLSLGDGTCELMQREKKKAPANEGCGVDDQSWLKFGSSMPDRLCSRQALHLDAPPTAILDQLLQRFP